MDNLDLEDGKGVEDDDDDDEVERELLREEGGDREEGTSPSTIAKPSHDDSTMPGHLKTQDDPFIIRPRRHIAPPPGFFKEKNAELRGEGRYKEVPVNREAELAAFIAEVDEMCGQEGRSVAQAPGIVSALAVAMAAAQDTDTPTYDEAMSGNEKEKWLEAIKEEVAQIEKMHTYDIVEADQRDIANIIGSRFVLRRKRDSEGNISRYKARLVGKGFSQRPGIDFNENFAPTIRPVTLRLISGLGAHLRSAIEQADAKNTYLNSVLPPNEIIYMHLPPILYDLHLDLLPRLNQAKADGKILVLRLWGPLYGTKQGGNKWYEELCFVLKKLGLTKSAADHALFYRSTGPGNYCLLRVATDDFTYVADSTETIRTSDLQARA